MSQSFTLTVRIDADETLVTDIQSDIENIAIFATGTHENIFFQPLIYRGWRFTWSKARSAWTIEKVMEDTP